ncbi:MAG: histidine kinase [Dokdonella sp.]|uniref:sensor histidine kinase n=1 Tax=Dokdonella sp. TaxID=2291710 RepID=UPI003265E8DF
MTDDATPPAPRGLERVLQWRRMKIVLVPCALFGLLLAPGWQGSRAVLFARLLMIGLAGLLAFGLFERWPVRLPRMLARWALQVIAVAIAMPFAAFFAYSVTTMGLDPPWYIDKDRVAGFAMMTVLGLLIAPWMAMSALMRQRDEAVRSQAVSFERERSELERKALDARLRLLQSQVEPHFLFNTLANVRELVDSGSPQASTVLDSLIAYLRAAVPRLHEPSTTLGQELQLVRAYLELMHLRMPDRLQFTLQVDDAALPLECPPITLLTLVENAVRHGIDPSEEGGRIDVIGQLVGTRCRLQVRDTGVGQQSGVGGLGTGLSTLRERLQLVFGDDARLRLDPVQPHGVCADIEFPARPVAA